MYYFYFRPVLFPFVALILYYCLWFPFSATPPTSLVPSYSFALFCFGFSSWLESLAEPFIIVSLRLAMNAEYAFLQSLLTVLQRLLVLIFITSGVLSHIDAFCFAQVNYLLVYLLWLKESFRLRIFIPVLIEVILCYEHVFLQIISSLCYLIVSLFLVYRQFNRRKHIYSLENSFRTLFPSFIFIPSKKVFFIDFDFSFFLKFLKLLSFLDFIIIFIFSFYRIYQFWVH